MAATPPRLPADFRALIPAANASWCVKLLGWSRLALYVLENITWAVNDDGTATDDFLAWIGQPVGTLSPPIGVSATDGDFASKVVISWSAAAGATSYQVYRSTSSDSSTAALIGTTGTTSLDDNTPVSDQVYYYWVKSVAGSVISDFSASDTGYAASGANEITFDASATWEVPVGVTSIVVEVWADGGGGAGRGRPAFGTPGTFYAGGGGGGGEYATGTIAVTPGNDLTITVGQGGAAGSSDNAPGSNGGGAAMQDGATLLISCNPGSGAPANSLGSGSGGAGGTGGSDGIATGVTRNAGVAGSSGSGANGGAGGATNPVESGVGTGGEGSDTSGNNATAGLHGRIKITW